MKSLKTINKLLQGSLKGDPGYRIKGVNSLDSAMEDEIAIAAKDLPDTKNIKAGALVVKEGSNINHKNLIYVKDPYIALSELIGYFFPDKRFCEGIMDNVYISPDAVIGKNVSIGNFSYIGNGVLVGDNCEIHAGVVLYDNVNVGEGTKIYSNVVIREEVVVGRNSIIQPGAVIGSDGFGFARDNEGRPVKIPQKGNVKIGENCEIGANVCIDRSTLETTIIKDNVKIDNLVQIGHNVKVGKSTSISAQSGISGSTEVGDNVIMAGQVGLADHIRVGNNVIVAAKAGITGNVKDKSIVAGIPHQDLMSWKKSHVILRNIEKYIDKIKILEKKVDKMEGK
ncbi:MAG: UDP-3-O-(3-hydroxymyristoyl)glucosamine N-acyltransferase [Acidobacteriota bacterium]